MERKRGEKDLSGKVKRKKRGSERKKRGRGS